jgi:hypothetical protein
VLSPCPAALVVISGNFEASSVIGQLASPRSYKLGIASYPQIPTHAYPKETRTRFVYACLYASLYHGFMGSASRRG